MDAFFIWQPVGQKLTKDLIKVLSAGEHSFLLLFITTLTFTVIVYTIIDMDFKYVKNIKH